MVARFAQQVWALPVVRDWRRPFRLATKPRKDAPAAGIRDLVGGDLIPKIIEARDSAARFDDNPAIGLDDYRSNSEIDLIISMVRSTATSS